MVELVRQVHHLRLQHLQLVGADRVQDRFGDALPVAQNHHRIRVARNTHDFQTLFVQPVLLGDLVHLRRAQHRRLQHLRVTPPQRPHFHIHVLRLLEVAHQLRHAGLRLHQRAVRLQLLRVHVQVRHGLVGHYGEGNARRLRPMRAAFRSLMQDVRYR